MLRPPAQATKGLFITCAAGKTTQWVVALAAAAHRGAGEARDVAAEALAAAAEAVTVCKTPSSAMRSGAFQIDLDTLEGAGQPELAAARATYEAAFTAYGATGVGSGHRQCPVAFCRPSTVSMEEPATGTREGRFPSSG